MLPFFLSILLGVRELFLQTQCHFVVSFTFCLCFYSFFNLILILVLILIFVYTNLHNKLLFFFLLPAKTRIIFLVGKKFFVGNFFFRFKIFLGKKKISHKKISHQKKKNFFLPFYKKVFFLSKFFDPCKKLKLFFSIFYQVLCFSLLARFFSQKNFVRR